jgi:deoxycytidylate deaminase
MISENIINDLISSANESTIDQQLSAVLVKNNKIISQIKNNEERSLCRGNLCHSFHAEARAILNYFGKDLKFDKMKNQWCLLPRKKKKKKVK